MKLLNVFHLPSGRVFLLEAGDGFKVECTEMRDVRTSGKENEEVRSSTDPRVVWNHLAPYSEKWLLTVSTQKGCPHKCRFCDVAPLGFHGNLSRAEILEQVYFLLENTPYVKRCRKAKIGFARMGEPSHNLKAVLSAMEGLPRPSEEWRWLPCFNSILPARTLEGLAGEEVVERVMDFKERSCGGFLHFQVSCNSTDEGKRRELFGGAEVMPLKSVVEAVGKMKCTGRTVTLNFIAMKGVEVDPDKLMRLGLDPEKFTVKLIPMNRTANAAANGLETYADYGSYDKLKELAEGFARHGIPVVYDSIAKCEEAGLCCGQLASKFCGEAGV
ncbi:MAG: hypothetical protein J6Y62_06870 [Clostridia bacterium]|nr:hypothetical protein [Clostridia bacterium]